MGNCNIGKQCTAGCVLEVIISIIIGVVVGILFANGLIPVTLNFIKIALVVSAIAMAMLGGSLFAANIIQDEKNAFKKCICKVNICLLVSALGTLIAATIAATAGLTTSFIVSILAVAFTAFFFSWVILSIGSLILCLIRKTCAR